MSGREHLVRATKRVVRRTVRSLGYDLVPLRFDPEFAETWREAAAYTMTPPHRLYALCEAVRYVVERRVPGDIVECGVWKGGSMLAVARTLNGLGDTSRDLWLYDTFTGMTSPTPGDVRHDGASAAQLLEESSPGDAEGIWTVANEDAVRRVIARAGYPAHRTHFVRGRVEDTIPDVAPDRIAALRLDTDWYESTRHELDHLYGRISPGGVLVLDDYGYWRGARRAVDDFFSDRGARPFLVPIDPSARMIVVEPG